VEIQTEELDFNTIKVPDGYVDTPHGKKKVYKVYHVVKEA